MPSATELRLRLATGLASELAIGDSVAVNGVCLTVISTDGENIYADVSPETARVTAIGSLKRGALVNLERPLRADARIGGHFVQGHVDGTGRIDEIRREGDSWWITIEYPSALAPSIVRKGSIAVDGISLTVAGVDNRRFDVQIIPYTWEHTNLRTLRVGEAVNLECDILGKYVFRALEVAAHGR
jgi:riboflavin synthase